MAQFDNVSVLPAANIYFDGKCISHTIILADGTKKTLGVILPSKLTFNTGTPEIMEGVQGSCRVQFAGSTEVHTFAAGESFKVPGQSSFEIEVTEPYHYVCHYG